MFFLCDIIIEYLDSLKIRKVFQPLPFFLGGGVHFKIVRNIWFYHHWRNLLICMCIILSKNVFSLPTGCFDKQLKLYFLHFVVTRPNHIGRQSFLCGIAQQNCFFIVSFCLQREERHLYMFGPHYSLGDSLEHLNRSQKHNNMMAKKNNDS